MPNIEITCPYCEQPHAVSEPTDYAPKYEHCGSCGKRFIVEPAKGRIDVYRDGEAPCCSDPDCRATEMGADDS